MSPERTLLTFASRGRDMVAFQVCGEGITGEMRVSDQSVALPST